MGTINRNGDLPEVSRPVQGSFVGKAVQHPLHDHPAPTAARVSFVSFEPGSRTHWHTHGGGQVLHVVEGSGFTQVEGGPMEQIRAGDTVTVGPGEKHWHGAGPEEPMRHLAVTLGEVVWLEAPPAR